MKRLIHDVAWATAKHILELVTPLLREEEKRDAFVELYTRVKAGLEVFEIQQTRHERRMNPGRN